MKRHIALLMGAMLLLICILGGCGSQPAENPSANPGPSANPANPATPANSEEKTALSVYVVKNDALYQKAVNAFKREMKDQDPNLTVNITTFDTYEAMFDVMNIELMAKGGPDVVLYNCMQSDAIDAQKLAQSGMFLPLDSYIEDLDPEIYPTVLMDAGHIAGKQYFIPLSYNLMYAFTTEKLMADRGYSPSDSIYEMICKESDALMGVADKTPSLWATYAPEAVNCFFDVAGVRIFDKNTGEVILDKAEAEEICRFVKSAIFDNQEKFEALYEKAARDWTTAVKTYSFFTEDYAFMNNVRFYQSMFPAKADSPMVALPYHKLNNPEELCASIVCFGGVNANTKATEKAYALLKYILDFNVTNSFMKYEESQVYYAPVSLAVYQKAMEELVNSMGVGPVTINQLSEENAGQLAEVPQRITYATILNRALGTSFNEILDPYFRGEDSFDNCYKTLLNRLQLYISE